MSFRTGRILAVRGICFCLCLYAVIPNPARVAAVSIPSGECRAMAVRDLLSFRRGAACCARATPSRVHFLERGGSTPSKVYSKLMATDLYSADLRTISGNDVYKAITEFLRLDLPKENRPREGYLLDFKEELSDRFLHSVAAFANTFGGLLILGVKEDDGRPHEIVGVNAKGELKTQVASLIASNLFPSPPFDIAEADIPGDTDRKKVCAIRIRETPEICLLAKKGEKHPIYVRIEDQSGPADAAQIRSLLEEASGRLSRSRFRSTNERLGEPAVRMHVR